MRTLNCELKTRPCENWSSGAKLESLSSKIVLPNSKRVATRTRRIRQSHHQPIMTLIAKNEQPRRQSGQ